MNASLEFVNFFSNKERRLEVTFQKEIQIGEITRLEFLKAEVLKQLTNLGLFLSKYQDRSSLFFKKLNLDSNTSN